MADAQANLRNAIGVIDDMRGACNAVVVEAREFRDNVSRHTLTLREIVDRLEVIRATIGDNVAYLRQQWVDATALAADAARAGACNPQEIADALNRVAGAADIQLNRLDEVNDALAFEVERAGLQVRGLEDENPREGPAGGGGGGGGGGGAAAAAAAGQGGGRRRHRSRGGHTPNRCKKCCGKGTKHVKHGRCVSRRTKRRRRRRRRR